MPVSMCALYVFPRCRYIDTYVCELNSPMQPLVILDFDGLGTGFLEESLPNTKMNIVGRRMPHQAKHPPVSARNVIISCGSMSYCSQTCGPTEVTEVTGPTKG